MHPHNRVDGQNPNPEPAGGQDAYLAGMWAANSRRHFCKMSIMPGQMRIPNAADERKRAFRTAPVACGPRFTWRATVEARGLQRIVGCRLQMETQRPRSESFDSALVYFGMVGRDDPLHGFERFRGKAASVACENASAAGGEPELRRMLGWTAARYVDVDWFTGFIQPEKEHVAAELEDGGHQAASHLFSGLRAKSKMISSLLCKNVLRRAMS